MKGTFFLNSPGYYVDKSHFLNSMANRNRKNRKSGFMHQKLKTGGKYQKEQGQTRQIK